MINLLFTVDVFTVSSPWLLHQNDKLFVTEFKFDRRNCIDLALYISICFTYFFDRLLRVSGENKVEFESIGSIFSKLVRNWEKKVRPFFRTDRHESLSVRLSTNEHEWTGGRTKRRMNKPTNNSLSVVIFRARHKAS